MDVTKRGMGDNKVTEDKKPLTVTEDDKKLMFFCYYCFKVMYDDIENIKYNKKKVIQNVPELMKEAFEYTCVLNTCSNQNLEEKNIDLKKKNIKTNIKTFFINNILNIYNKIMQYGYIVDVNNYITTIKVNGYKVNLLNIIKNTLNIEISEYLTKILTVVLWYAQVYKSHVNEIEIIWEDIKYRNTIKTYNKANNFKPKCIELRF